MSGTLPLREAALAAVKARLDAQLPDVVTERARRAAVDTDAETMPRLVLEGGALGADTESEPGRTHYQVDFTIRGYARAADAAAQGAAADLSAEQALSLLHARVAAALDGWTPTDAGLGDVQHRGADFVLFDAEDCARPAGEVTARFSMLAVATTGGPFSS